MIDQLPKQGGGQLLPFRGSIDRPPPAPMHIVPRCKEDHTLEETGDKLSVNALGFAGMLLVKSEEELEVVKREGTRKILRDVGLESVRHIQVEGSSQCS